MIKKKKTQVELINKGRIYISASFNNTLVTVTNEKGSPVLMGSCGMSGFSGTRKSTPYAAIVTVQNILKKAMETHGMRFAQVYVKGIGPGREASLRTIKSVGLEVGRVLDITPVPHNGVRPPKQRKG